MDRLIDCPQCGEKFDQTELCRCGYEHSCGGPEERCCIPGCSECGTPNMHQLRAHILRNWKPGDIRAFALHLLGANTKTWDKYETEQIKAAVARCGADKINFHLHKSGLQTWELIDGTPIMQCPYCDAESEWPWGDSHLEAVCPDCGNAVDYETKARAEA